jgi:hypothetical protein
LCTRFNAQGCTFNAQGLRIIIMVAKIGGVKIEVATTEVFKKKEK